MITAALLLLLLLLLPPPPLPRLRPTAAGDCEGDEVLSLDLTPSVGVEVPTLHTVFWLLVREEVLPPPTALLLSAGEELPPLHTVFWLSVGVEVLHTPLFR